MQIKNKLLLFGAIICSFLTIANTLEITFAQGFRLERNGFVPVQARQLNLAPKDMIISGTIQFQLRNEAELDLLIKQQQDSTNSNYLKWLTPREFGERFGATEQTYQETIDYLKKSGIEVSQTWPNQLRLDFKASVLDIEKVFQIQMHLFEVNNQLHYGHLERVMLPSNLISEIADVRLNNFVFTHPTISQQSEINSNFTDQTGRRAIGAQDFQVAYNFNPLFANGIEGNGQSIGIVARSDFNMSDVEQYRSLFKLPPSSITKIPAGGEIVDRGGVETLEVLLDTQLSSAAAPKADIKVVIADRDSDIDQSLAFLINNLPETKVLSISFGACEKFLFPQFEALFNNLYKQAVAQGQTIVVSSGDSGVNDCGDGLFAQVNGLAASPFVTAVGGTSLRVDFDQNGNVTKYQGEQSWSGSGGGVSNIFPLTDYQSNVGISFNGRAVPDVALLADPSQPGFFVVRDGITTVIGGTSTSAPVWAGILALTNQTSHTKGLGNANPRIYSLGRQQQLSASPLAGFFNDVTSGNNSGGGLAGFNAQAGYDLCTGWGSPNVDRFARSFMGALDNQKGLFLIFPNGSEVLEKDKPATISWNLSETLAAKAMSQTLMFSSDEGKTFKPIASNLSVTTRSFNFVPNFVTTTAKFRIVVNTTNGDVIDTSDANVNIGTNLRIDFARYSILSNQIEIIGEELSEKAKLFVNGVRIDRPSKRITGGLAFKGKTKKLKLKPGENLVLLEIDNIRSAPYKLFL